jgi:hypothetical protein
LIDSWSWSNANFESRLIHQSESHQISDCHQVDEDTFFNKEVMLFTNKRQKINEEENDQI